MLFGQFLWLTLCFYLMHSHITLPILNRLTSEEVGQGLVINILMVEKFPEQKFWGVLQLNCGCWFISLSKKNLSQGRFQLWNIQMIDDLFTLSCLLWVNINKMVIRHNTTYLSVATWHNCIIKSNKLLKTSDHPVHKLPDVENHLLLLLKSWQLTLHTSWPVVK